ncbi:MAG: GDSL-type esterase/lipase family protein [Myxococcota bacterium]
MLLALSGPRLGAAQDRAAPHIEDPSGHALDALHRALRRAEQDEGTARLLFYGASHTSSDQYTGYLRRLLQPRFGDAGHGFVLPARPFTFYNQRDARIRSSGPWRTLRVRGRDRRPGIYGLLGAAVETRGRARASIEPRRRRGRGSEVAFFEVFYLEQREGGSMEILIDDVVTERIRTEGQGLGYARYDVPLGAHRLELRTQGDGPVRLFGIVMETGQPGVIVEPLGIPGSRAEDQLPWDADAQAEHLRRRAPDLLVLAYGTNESGYRRFAPDAYEEKLRQVVQRARRAAPQASCLLIGPSEWPERVNGTWVPRESTAAIIAVQRRVAQDHGCGFFDLVRFIGGPGSMEAWVNADPPLALDDHVHYTEHGHRRLAEALAQALLTGY